MNGPSSVVHGNSDTGAHMSVADTDGCRDLPKPIAQGIARRDVLAGNNQDLMFMAGERVLLLQRLNGEGLCMGMCKDVIGRFNEADVDFKGGALPGDDGPFPLSPTAPPIPPKSRSRASSATSTVSEKKTQDSEPVPRLRKKSSTLGEGTPFTSTLSRPIPMAALVDSSTAGRPRPKKLVSDENLKVSPSDRRHILPSPPSPCVEQSPSSMPVIPPRSSSRQSKSAGSQDQSPGVRPLATKSSTVSINSLADPYGSSATIVTNSLDIKTNELASHPQRPSPVRQSHRSQPSSRKSSMSSKAIPPLVLDPSNTYNLNDQHSLRSPSSIHHEEVSRTRHSRRSSLEDPHSQEQLERGQHHKEHGHYLTSILDNIRAKTHHVIQQTGFSMAPTAGLYADRGTENVDLRVVQMPPTSPTATTTTIAAGVKAATSTISSPISGVSFAISATGPGKATSSDSPNKKHGRPRSRSVREDHRPPQSSSMSDTAAMPMPESATSVLGRFRPWGRSPQRQRSNSGPPRHSDSSLQEKMEAFQVVRSQVPPPHEEEEQSTRPRRTSEATSTTGASVVTTLSCPPSQHMMDSELKVDPNSIKNRPKNWFGIGGRRSSIPSVDMRKPHPLGEGIEGGIVGRHMSTLVDDDDDDDDTDEEDDEEGRKSSDNSRFYVNDYGFIYELDDEMNQGQDLTGTGSNINGPRGSTISAITDTDRKREMKKLKHTRENELKWVHAATRLQADNVKKSSKYKKLVRRGIPPSVRGRVWLFLARADRYRQPGMFDELCKRGHLPIYEVIERDIHRCYPDHVHFRDGTGTGQQDLHAVLRAYAHYKPSVGYCQGMGRLVGMMLMQMPVEDTFWLLVATIEDYMQDYYTPSLRQLRIDAQVFERLLKDQDPVLADHLEKNDVIPLMYMTQWFMTLYTMSLPWASVLRVWDVFYFDGVKALFRIGLAILQLSREHLLIKCPSSSELLAYILHIPLEKLAPKPLLEAALHIRLKKQSVQKLIAVTAESMDAATATPKASPPPSTSSKRSVMTTTSNITSASNVSTVNDPSPGFNDADTPKASVPSRPGSPVSSAAPIAVPPTPASPSSSSFSPLGVFKTRKRAGTIHK